METGSPACTHLVVDEHSINRVPFETHPRCHIVKSEVSIFTPPYNDLFSKLHHIILISAQRRYQNNVEVFFQSPHSTFSGKINGVQLKLFFNVT